MTMVVVMSHSHSLAQGSWTAQGAPKEDSYHHVT
jgi:hypothetical protein